MHKPLSQFAGLYREWRPPLALQDHLSCIWVNDLTQSSVNDFLVVPDGCVDILWNGGGLYTVPDSTAATTVLHQALLNRLARVGQADPQVAFLRNEAAVTSRNSDAGGFRDLSRRIGLSERTLRRRCIEVFGYGFKTLQKILRFQRLLRLAAHAPGSSLATLALECGFADH